MAKKAARKTRAKAGAKSAASSPPKKPGRPTLKTPEMVEAILGDLYEGLSLRALTAKQDRPSLQTVCRWFNEDPAFREQYMRAHEAQGMMAGSMILDVTRSCLVGSVRPDVARVVIQGLQTSAAQMAPKLWGPRAQHEHHHSGEVRTGVLVVPGTAETMDEWVQNHALDPDGA